MSNQDDYTKEGPVLPGTDDYYSHTNVAAGGKLQEGIGRGSDDSKEMIIRKDGIRKDVRYVVEYGDQN